MNPNVKAKALRALDRMRQVVEHEMLVVGLYAENDVSHPELVDAPCGGRRHCAIGSLWVGYGIKGNGKGYLYYLPGAEQTVRKEFLRNRPALRAAYNALNTQAQKFADEAGLELENDFTSQLEGLFEGYYGDALTKRDFLYIIDAARTQVAVS